MLSKAEKSYIQSSLLSNPPLRADGRTLHDFRTVSLQTDVAPLANGSARVNIGRNPGGGTEVLAAVKLDVDTIHQDGSSSSSDTVDGGRIVCTVSCSPAAYPHLSSPALDNLQHDLSTILNQTLSHPSLHPSNLTIIPAQKSWLLNLDLLVLTDAGNIYDALFIAARAALYNTKVPKTRAIEYRATTTTTHRHRMDVDNPSSSSSTPGAGLDTLRVQTAADFELPDYWDQGESLAGRDRWPVSVTLNLVPPIHYLDATTQEEISTPLRLLLVFAFPDSSSSPNLQATRLIGPGYITSTQLKQCITHGEKYARDLYTSLNAKLKDEDIKRNQMHSSIH